MTDMLAKEAIPSNQSEKLNIPVPKSSLKRELREWAIQEWQKEWENAAGGRSTYKIHSKVSIKTKNWSRELTLFFTGHGPFPSYLRRFHLHHSKFCTCSLTGTPSLCHSLSTYQRVPHDSPILKQHYPLLSLCYQ
ncbi:hypothetical protein AVEN_177134-1 [Araneus ventricosus]|uniref:Uncharacterized protein n=1 Tax=Araneus ventricosus TaxID=182803 RepID=A0A4Y2HLY3_ARAVE|nr:hypothetical protein AVEN_177134-1 [Araneus ventricosus]